ncbi:MAG: signal peptidase II [Actinomycetota bacterium]|nr:signal peptidase II [Actinomycetota bacterium]
MSRKGRQGRGFGAYAFFVSSSFLLVVLDQASKSWARSQLAPGSHLTLVPGLVDLTLVYNQGAAFGILEGARWLFVIIAACFILAALVYLSRREQGGWLDVMAISLICAGAVGNLIDRLFIPAGVTDFIEATFIEFPVFNIADICVTLGCALLIIHVLIGVRRSADEPGAD